jgi:putative acetyltransferase
MMRIIDGDFSDVRVIDLLRIHLASSRANTAPGSAHALDLAGLQSPEISFWTIWNGETLLGCGALKRLAPGHGEIKSMHTAQAVRRTGVGSAMLRHIVTTARARGTSRLSLETGSWDHFAPARALYARHGFVECGPFADYVLDPNSVFMTRDLRET